MEGLVSESCPLIRTCECVCHTHTRTHTLSCALTNVVLKEIHYIKTKITRKNNLVKTLEYLSFKLKLSSITWESEADLLSGSGGQSLFRDIVDPHPTPTKEIKSEKKAQTGAPPGEPNLVTTVAQIDTACP